MTEEHPMLAKIRALLAKAEGTDSEHEAEICRAKATELMVKHAIDAALLEAKGNHEGKIVAVNIEIQAPYGDEKANFWHWIATALGCKVVAHYGVTPPKTRYASNGRRNAPRRKPMDSITLFGYESDVERVQLLVTSLLAQLSFATARASKEWPEDWRGGSGSQWKKHTRSYLVGWTHTVSHRVTDAYQTATNEAVDGEPGAALVLYDRAQRVQDFVDEHVGAVEAHTSRKELTRTANQGRTDAKNADIGLNRIGQDRKALR